MYKLASTGYGFFKKLLYVVAVIFIMLGLAYQFAFKSSAPQLTTRQALEYEKAKLYDQLNKLKADITPEGQSKYYLFKITHCTFLGQACSDDPKNAKNDFNDSYLSSVAGAISFAIVNPPASGVVYVADGLQNAGFIPQTYAAEGVGFAAIKPLTSVWKVLRDLAYIVLVIVMVIIGFMIMFRTQIDSQTVISIENSLPRIVITLLLITFSFPIAGFMIDMMYVIIALVVSILSPDPNMVGELQNQYLSATPGQIFDSLIPLNSAREANENGVDQALNVLIFKGYFPLGAVDAIQTFWQTSQGILLVIPEVIKAFIYLIGIYGLMAVVTKILYMTDKIAEPLAGLGALTFNIGGLPKIANIVVLLIGFIIGGIILAQFIILLLIFFTVCLIFFRIFFLLLSSYLKILIMIIFSPVILLLEALPGQEAFAQWIKNLFGEIMSFPAVIALFMVANRLTVTILESAANDDVLLSGINDIADLQKTFWTPPFLYGLNQEALAFIVGMGILFIIPDLIKVFKEALGVKEFPVKIGLGTFFAGGAVAVGGGVSLLTQFSSVQQALLGDNRGLANFFKKATGDAGADAPAISNPARRAANNE